MTIIIGTLGALLVLVFFILEQLNVLKNSSLIYDAGNLIGSALLVTYAILLSSVPFAILNGIWALFSLKDVILDLKKTSN